jgi:AGZA family xanthine/uracil permease-like MFS transporter
MHENQGEFTAAAADVAVLQQEVRRSLITATAATSLMATALMGAFANMPLSVAPGMGEPVAA